MNSTLSIREDAQPRNRLELVSFLWERSEQLAKIRDLWWGIEMQGVEGNCYEQHLL